MASGALRGIVRSRFTWMTYFLILYFGLAQTIPGPAVPFLREELGLSRTVAGMHSSLFAMGALLVGFYGDRVADWFGNRITMWGAASLSVAGLMLFTVGQTPLLTLPGMLALGLGCGELAMLVTSTLGDEHRERRATAITESTLMASIGVVIAPLLVGQFQAVGTGWRMAVLVAIVYLLILAVVFRHTKFPASLKTEATHDENNSLLPPLFWIYGVVLFLSVAIEWSFVFWTADYLIETVNLEPGLASSMVSVFVGAIFLGRLVGSRITARYRLGRLLLAAIGTILVGFPLFWLGSSTIMKVIGLFVVGLGLANMFPLTLSACTLAAPTQTNRASARISILGGGAILVSPQILGAVADASNIQAAYGMVLLLALASVGVVLYANHRAAKAQHPV